MGAPISAGVATCALALTLWALARQRARLRAILGAASAPELRVALDRVAAGIAPLEDRASRIEDGLNALLTRDSTRLRPPGVVHFQAYGQDGPALSFSIALVNERQDGVVLTSLYGRDQVRLFAKHLVGGRSGAELATEEQQALALALAGGGAATNADPGPVPHLRARSARRTAT